MIKMNVSAETFDGDMVTETLWFHMNKVDLIDLQQSEADGLRRHASGVHVSEARGLDQEGQVQAVRLFPHHVDKAYGERRPTVSDSRSRRRFLPSSRTASSTTSSF